MSQSRNGLPHLTTDAFVADGWNARVFGAFGAASFSFYFSYFSFSKSLPAGQAVV